MSERDVTILIGTSKGAFMAHHRGRGRWSLEGPLMEGWEILHLVQDRRTGVLYAAANSPFYGPAVRRSDDFGRTWDSGGTPPAYPEGDPEKVTRVWHITPGREGEPHRLYAGVEASGLFVSDDDGETWTEIASLRRHPTHDTWFPGNGGKCLHTIVLDPFDERRMFIACSTGGVYRSDDAGENWRPVNRGIRAEFMPEDQQFPEAGQCVHKVSASAVQPGRLYLQNHGGVYRSDDAGENWQPIDAGLPANLAHPRRAGTAYVIPLISGMQRRFPGERLAVWRTDDGGETWRELREGLAEPSYVCVLRDVFAVDDEDPAGLYFGTTSGSVYASFDEGESWMEVARDLPRIVSVEAARPA